MRSTVPIESLSKGRGTNNDSLSNAMNSRLVVVNESNGPAKLDTGTFNALICGEETTHKKMYQEEVNSDPTMKWLFLLNDLPEFEKGAYHSARRCAFLPMKKIYYDHERDLDKQLMAEHRARGGLECLIGTKDILYYQNHVQGKEGSFLRFFVEGAKAYYGAGQKINLPPTMQFQAKSETMDVTTAIDDFVFERLAFEDGKKVLVADMHTEFLLTNSENISDLTCSSAKFGKDLAESIRKCPGLPETVRKSNTRVNGRAGMAYVNVRMTVTEV